jgi:hypothetical protein
MVRLVSYVCGEVVRAPDTKDQAYAVTAVGSADCLGTEVMNERYSKRRQRNAVRALSAVLKQVEDWRHSERPAEELHANIRRLREAAERPEVDNVTQPIGSKHGPKPCGGSGIEADLWPWSTLSDGLPASAEVSPLRASVLRISRRTVDVEDRLRMVNGLTRNTTMADMIYFSFVSFTTTGYGDIKAVSGPVRFCVIVENILELLFTAVFFTAAMANR